MTARSTNVGGAALRAARHMGSTPYTRNWTAAGLTKTIAGLARVRAGTGRMKVVVAPADSRGSGVGATRSTGPTAALASALATAWGVQVNTNSLYGVGTSTGTAAAAASFDSRVTYTGTPVPSFNNFGGYAFRLATSGEKYLFALGQGDSWELEWLTFPGNGTFNLYLDGSLYGANPISCNTAAGINKLTVSGLSDTTHTWTIEQVSGTVNFLGLRGWRSTVPAIDFIAGGCPGLKTDDWDTNGTGIAPRTALTTIGAGADLMVGQLMTNDENANTYPSTAFNGHEANLIAYVKQTMASDFIMVIPGWEQVVGSVTQAVQQRFREAAWALSDSTNTPLYDCRAIWPDWLTMNGLGLFSTGVHEVAAGYTAEYGSIGLAGAISAIIA